jgi:branched-chain amino acid transport system ATP-binding protein
MTTLTLDDVAISRGAGPVITQVSLTVQPGTITALVGPNGAGKTSLLESVSGIVQASAGRIAFNGKDITTISRRKPA